MVWMFLKYAYIKMTLLWGIKEWELNPTTVFRGVNEVIVLMSFAKFGHLKPQRTEEQKWFSADKWVVELHRDKEKSRTYSR